MVWEYTPRQMSGYLRLAAERLRLEAAERLNLGFAANRGEPKEVRKLVRELSRQ